MASVDSTDDTNHQIDISDIFSQIDDLLIIYGRKNNTQSYGGGTVLMNTLHSKPCCVSVYDNTDNIAIVYMYLNNVDRYVRVRRMSGSITCRFVIYYR